MRASRQILFLSFFAPAVFAGQDYAQVQGWLEKMSRAASTFNYKGTFVYSHDQGMTTMRIVHRVSANGEQERLVSLDGPKREVIRNNDEVTCIFPDKNTVIVQKNKLQTQFTPVLPIRLGSLRDYYRFSLAQQGQIAGRQVQEIIIQPRDRYRYGYNLWVDQATGLLLKSYLLNEHGQTIEKFMFTEIEYLKTVSESLLKPGLSGQTYTWHQNSVDGAGSRKRDQGWMNKKLPSGFKLDLQRDHRISTGRMPMDQLVFTDGLATVSVFVEKHMADDNYLVGSSRMGAVNAHGRIIDDYHITAIGEVPQATVKAICESIYYKNHQ